MELTQQYLDSVTVIADFWIANNNNKIVSFANEGISVEKSKTYLNKYFINIFVKKEHYSDLNKYAFGWEKKFPKAVISKASGKIEAYELKFKKAVEKENHWVLEFAGELSKD